MGRGREINTEPYAEVMRQALAAYVIDAGYAVEMCASASGIYRKRATWEARKAVRGAEAEALAQCSAATTFTCSSPSPCGTGRSCRFASGEVVLLEVPLKPGKSTRPQPHSSGEQTYDVENAVRALVAMREGSTQAT